MLEHGTIADEASSTHDRALERWGAAARRLGLDAVAAAVGSCLLLSEVGQEEPDTPRPLRRCDDLRIVGEAHGHEAAVKALLTLEARGIVQPVKWESGAWSVQQLELGSRVREHCAGPDLPRAPSVESHYAVPRVREALERVESRCA